MNLFKLLLFVFISNLSFGQGFKSEGITPKDLTKIKSEIEKDISKYQKLLTKKNNYSATQIEFCIDTFRIERLVAKKMEIDYSISGMNKAIDEMGYLYDSLMNKYYILLINSIDNDKKNNLITAQKKWLLFRDAEFEFINKLIEQNDQLMGGGYINSNTKHLLLANLVKKRAIEIAEYYLFLNTN